MTKRERQKRIIELTKNLARNICRADEMKNRTPMCHYFAWIGIEIDGIRYAPICAGSGCSDNIQAVMDQLMTLPGVHSATYDLD